MGIDGPPMARESAADCPRKSRRRPKRANHQCKSEASMRSSLVPFALNLSFALLAAQAGAAQKFAITDLGTLPGGMSSVGSGINPSGQVTGDSETSDSPAHAF